MQQVKAQVEPRSTAAITAADRLDRQAGELCDTAEELRKKKLHNQADDLEQVAESLVATAQLLRDGIVAPEERHLRVIGGRGHAVPDDAIRDAIRSFEEPFSYHEFAKLLGINPQTAKKKLDAAIAKQWVAPSGFRQLGKGRPTPLYFWKRPAGKSAPRPTGGRDHHLNGLDPLKVQEQVKRGAPIALGNRPKHAWPDVERIFKVAEENGYELELRGTSHWKVHAPDGRILFGVSNTPPSRQSLIKIRHDFRRLGLPV